MYAMKLVFRSAYALKPAVLGTLRFSRVRNRVESLGHESKSESEFIKTEIYESEPTSYESWSDVVNSSSVKFSP